MEPRRSNTLHRDTSGAVMVIGVFMAMLVTGFLYYIVGIGNTIIYRERMQDAADAIAFAGAVIHARGMNLVALINIVLALLMTIYLVLRLVMTGLFIAAGIAAAFLNPIAVPLGVWGNNFRNMGDTYRRSILEPALRLGHSAEDVIRRTYPLVAQANAIAISRSAMYSPPVTIGLMHPVADHPLPLRPMDFMRFCRRAADPIANFLTWPLAFLGPLRSWVARALSGLVATIYCSDFNDQNMRPYEIDPGRGDCSDGMPGQDCEYVQIRSMVMGNTPFDGNERGVAIGAWGRNTGGGLFGTIGQFGRFGVAQAEYYYDGSEGRDEWVWHMYWRARFRRFRMPSSGLGLGGFGGGVDLSVIDRLIVH